MSRASSGRTTTSITSAYTAVSSRIVPKPASVPPTATATTTASSDHATTSSIAAQASASTPTGVRCMRRSVRIRASTGNAVIDIAAPRKSANASGGTVCASGPATECAG